MSHPTCFPVLVEKIYNGRSEMVQFHLAALSRLSVLTVLIMEYLTFNEELVV